jgi:hypothetical protein
MKPKPFNAWESPEYLRLRAESIKEGISPLDFYLKKYPETLYLVNKCSEYTFKVKERFPLPALDIVWTRWTDKEAEAQGTQLVFSGNYLNVSSLASNFPSSKREKLKDWILREFSKVS